VGKPLGIGLFKGDHLDARWIDELIQRATKLGGVRRDVVSRQRCCDALRAWICAICSITSRSDQR